MNAYYDFMAARFERQMADLQPAAAYEAIHATVMDLGDYGFATVPTQYAIAAPRDRAGHRDRSCVDDLRRAHSLYAAGDLSAALDLARRVTSAAEGRGDGRSAIDSVHLQGRVYYDVESLAEAAECFAGEMDSAQCIGCVPSFARAVHELSRVHCRSYDLIRGEFGFRFALGFYACSMALRATQEEDESPGSDWQNLQAAIRCLHSLAELYGLMEEGPTEAVSLIQKLASPHLSVQDESGWLFLEARTLATMCLASLPAHRPILERMRQRASRLESSFPRMAAFMWEEAEFIADLDRGA